MSPSHLSTKLQEYYYGLSESERESPLCVDSLGDLFGGPKHLPIPPATCWFHATRVRPDTTFEGGILPLSTISDQIWAFLGHLARDWSTQEEWAAFRHNMHNMQGEGAERLRQRRKVADEGPHACLVKQTIFLSKELGHWNYLETPETVDDICLSYRKMFDQDLGCRFLAATSPCIVKFRSTPTGPEHLVRALAYLVTVLADDEIGSICVHNYDGEGRAVEPSAIVCVEWP